MIVKYLCDFFSPRISQIFTNYFSFKLNLLNLPNLREIFFTTNCTNFLKLFFANFYPPYAHKTKAF